MKPSKINKVRKVCTDLMEAALMLKMNLPIFASGSHPDWPIITDEVRGLRRYLERIETLLGETQPVAREDLQWHLCKYDMPDADTTVLVSARGWDDAQEAYLDLDGEELCWRFSSDGLIEAEVYAWADMPPSLNLRQAERLALPAPVAERRAS